MSSNFVGNFALSASLNQVWSMLNSQQVSVHAPMYKRVKFPANAVIMNQALIKIASFDLINTADWIDPYIYDLPEGDAFNINFEQCGYEQTQLITKHQRHPLDVHPAWCCFARNLLPYLLFQQNNAKVWDLQEQVFRLLLLERPHPPVHGDVPRTDSGQHPQHQNG